MAITRIGSISSLISTANSGSTTVTVGSGADLFVVGVSGYQNAVNYFTGGAMTLNGVTASEVAADASTSFFMGALFYWISPATGSQTLAWDWAGASAPSNGVQFAYASYSGVNTSDAVRDTFGGQNAGPPHATDTLTALTGDFIVAWAHAFSTVTPAFGWTNATEAAEVWDSSSAAGSWAEKDPTGDVIISVDETEEASDGGITAIVFKAAAAGGTTPKGPLGNPFVGPFGGPI